MRSALLGTLALVFGACGGAVPTSETDASPWFEEGARAAGLSFEHRSGHDREFYTPEVVSGGVALFDHDDDGRLDVYLVQAGSLLVPREERPGNRLFRNLGGRRFEDVTAGSGASDQGYGIGVAAGDADNDGRCDLYVTNLGPNVLLRNERGEAFEDVTGAAGVGDPGFGSSAAFFDYDLDGDLDLFVANYLIWSVESEQPCSNGLGQRDYCAPAVYNAPAVDVLYRNAGDGSFEDVTVEAGIDAAFGTGLGVVCGDFDGDGFPDVFVANDGRLDQLWMNEGGRRFQDRALALGCAMDQDGRAKAGMGVTAADLDSDGDLDVLVSNLRRETDSLYRNDGDYFTDVTARSGLGLVSRSFTRFGTGWADFDNDSWLDLYQANGRVASDVDGHGSSDPLAEPNLLFRGGPGMSFQECEPRGGTRELLVHTSRGAAFGDLDNDGGIDLVVANRDAAPYLLWNRAVRGRWLSVRVLDAEGRDALGAQVQVVFGERTLRREVRSAYSYCSASDARAHFGLGSGTSAVRLEVRWPDGEVLEREVSQLDRVLEVRPSGLPDPSEKR